MTRPDFARSHSRPVKVSAWVSLKPGPLAAKLALRFYPSHAIHQSFLILRSSPACASVPAGSGRFCVMRLNQATAAFLTGYFATHERGKKTESAYRSDLAQFLAFAGEESDLPSLDASAVEGWAARLRQEEYSPASIRRKMVVLKVFCSYWVRKGGLPESPFWRVKLSLGRIEQLPRALTEREVRALLSRAWRNYLTVSAGPDESKVVTRPGSPKSSCRGYRALRDLALVDLLFATGMRVGEVSALDVRDYFVREAVFRVQGKGGRDRLAFVVDEQTVLIQRAHMDASPPYASACAESHGA